MSDTFVEWRGEKPARGKFIVFEGIDGSGKTTQLELLRRKLALMSAKRRCYQTREPSDGIVGLLARGAVGGSIALDPKTLALLFAADRLEHVTKTVLPKLDQGFNVLCDRYYFSNYAYQGADVDIDRLIELNRFSSDLLRPDVTIFLDTPPEECIRRITERDIDPDIFENIETLVEVRRRYLDSFEKLASDEKILIVEPFGDADATAGYIWKRLVLDVFCDGELLG